MTTTATALDRVAELLVSERLGVVDAGLRMTTAKTVASDGSGAVHTTRLHADGWWTCSCPAGRYRPRRQCVHVAALFKVCPPSLRVAINGRRDRPAGEKEGGA